MSKTARRLWVASMLFAGITVGWGSPAAQGSDGAARNSAGQDAGSGTVNDKAYDRPAAKAGPPRKTLRGCLRKGGAANEYLLTAQDGANWEVISNSVKLNHHVGQSVTVTGVVEEGDKHGRMMVTDLTKLSDQCQ
jgi:hypothetical protein